MKNYCKIIISKSHQAGPHQTLDTGKFIPHVLIIYLRLIYSLILKRKRHKHNSELTTTPTRHQNSNQKSGRTNKQIKHNLKIMIFELGARRIWSDIAQTYQTMLMHFCLHQKSLSIRVSI